MASRKEWTMMFALQASLGASFAGTFGKAQQQLVAMEKEVQALNKSQGDIAAYQKQQSAVEATTGKLAMLQQQYDNIQKEMQETGNDSSELKNKLLAKQQQIERTSAALERQKAKLDEMAASMRAAGIDTGNLEEESRRLGKELEDLKKKQGDAADGADNFGNRASAAFEGAYQTLVAVGLVAALKELGESLMDCVNAAAEFEEVMSGVEAISGASAGEMDVLNEKAKELGATTKFTATEAGQAMTYMAMAGWDANEMLSGMDGVLSLAAASGEDLASVSDIVTDNLTAFGLKASDTAHFADVLAAAATNSNTNVGIMGETFKSSAAVAGALGYSIDDVAVAVGLMANAGVKGSMAGTALRNVFTGLLSGVTLTSEAFGEYEFSAVRADGTMKSFAETINELRGYFDQMTGAEQTMNAQTIAGQRGFAGLLSILNATDEDYASLTASIQNCSGAAQRMADIKMDNLNGQLTLMQSAWDGLKVTIGEQFSPVLRGVYEIATSVLTKVNQFVKDNPALVKAIAVFAGSIGLVVAALGAYTAATILAAKASAALSLAIPGVNVIMAVTAAVAGLVAVVTAIVSAANEGVPSVKELTVAAREMQETMEDATTTFSGTAEETVAAAAVADRYIAKLEEMGEYESLSTEQKKEYRNILSLLCETVPELSGLINVQTGEIEGGTQALRDNTQAWKDNAIAQAYQDELSKMYGAYADVLIEAEKNSIKLTDAQLTLDAATQRQAAIVARMNELWGEAATAAENDSKVFGYACDPINYLTQEYQDLADQLPEVNEEIRKAQKTVDNINEATEEDAEAVAEAEGEIALAEEAVKSLTGATEEQAEAERQIAEETTALNDVIYSTKEQIDALTEAYNTAYQAAFDSISGQYDLWDEAAEVVATSVESINSNLEGQAAYWADYNANLESLAGRTGDIEGLSDVIASFADGSTDSVNAIAGMAAASDEDLQQMVTNWLAVQDAQKAASGQIAEMKTDFTAQMDELAQNMRNDIESLELGPEAARAGRDTIQAFIDAADGMLPDVEAAYRRVANAASRSLNPVINGTSGRAYASGTESAEPGFALVGENGPELVYFRGGEQVMTAEETAAMQNGMQIMAFAPALMAALAAAPVDAVRSGGGGDVSLSVTFQIDGPVTSEGVEQLREYGDEFESRVLEVLEEAGIDTDRRRYV